MPTPLSRETGAVPDGRILGLDNIPLDLPLAGAGSRSLAAFLDYVVLGSILFIFVVGFGVFAVVSGPFVDRGYRGAWLIGIMILGIFAIEYGYFAATEALTGGRTAGKMVMKLRVVTDTGGRPGTAAFLIRNAVRTVDLVVGVPLMAIDPKSRRLGDRLAGTLVVHERMPDRQDVVLRRVPRSWGAREVAVLENLLRRASDLDPTRADELAQQLLAVIERDDPAFLEGVARDQGAVAILRAAMASD